MARQELYRKIPKIDKLMETPKVRQMAEEYGYTRVFGAARDAEEEIRFCIREESPDAENMIENLPGQMAEILRRDARQRMQKVINATGVILHTNLGRAPIEKETAKEIAQLMTGYTNLEFNLENGQRGSRYDHFSKNLCRLTGAGAAVAVNNNAAAVLVMLAALTAGKEVVVSRGELVEVGGKFRIPDVMKQSGTHLVEVGTTNRTYPEDYCNAVTPDTAAFLKVHTSNYKITGFTCEASVEELSAECRSLNIPLLVDLGSGSMGDFEGEASVREVLAKGADLVCFSGDKLFGGPQAGMIVGKKELIDRISRHPLMRAVRIDKFTASALDATVCMYLDEKHSRKKIPVLWMRNRPEEELWQQAERLKGLLASLENKKVSLEIRKTMAATGGGSLPGEEFPSIALFIRAEGLSPVEFAKELRLAETPVIARTENDGILLDMCTVFPEEVSGLAQVILQIL